MQANDNDMQHVQQILEQAGYALTRASAVPSHSPCGIPDSSESCEILLLAPHAAAIPPETRLNPSAHVIITRHELLAALQYTQKRLRIEAMQRRHTEAWLAQYGRYVQLLVDALPEGLCRLDQAGQIILSNAAAARMLGWKREALLGQAWDTLIPDGDAAPAKTWPQTATRDAGETTLRRQDGTRIRVAYTSTPLYDDGAYLGRLVLFSEYKAGRQPPQEMQHADRFALVGQLALALAHDISRPLQLMAENARLLRLELHAQGAQAPDVDAIVEQAERLSRLLATFLTLQEVTPEPVLMPVVLHEPLEQVLRLVQAHCACHAVTIRHAVPLDLPLVWGITDHLVQVFLNILMNALDAMPNGGTVTMTAEVIDDQRVSLIFHDTGCGMSPVILARTFEPFFSTKCRQGTGLGLTICHQIMVQHGGTIRLDSTPEGGTSVVLTFQVAEL